MPAGQVTTVAGAFGVRAPRAGDRRVDEATGERARFRGSILPPWCRRSPKVTEVPPLLSLHGLSSEDFVPALGQFPWLGAGLPAAAITRLAEAWQEEYRHFAGRGLPGAGYVYCWADGLHSRVRLDADRVCTLVVIGVRADGKKELAALTDGHRESTQSRPGCRATRGGGACAPRCRRPATGRWGSGPPCARCSPGPRAARLGAAADPLPHDLHQALDRIHDEPTAH
jgi:hypothetical protein